MKIKVSRLVAGLAAMAVFLTVLTAAAFCEPAHKLSLTPEEEAYVNGHKSVRIGYVADRIPVSFKDENGEFAGISRYIFDRVSRTIGIDFEYIPLPDGDITYDFLVSEKLDLVSSVEYNKENQNANGILISNPYLSSRKVVVASEGTEFRYDADLSIAISTGSQTIRKVLGAAYPNFSLVDYPSIESCFDAVRSGEADLLMQNQYVVEYWISKPIYEKLKVIPVLGLDDQLCFSAIVAFGDKEGTPAEDGRTLINIINKAIADMSEDEVGSYTIQGIMEYPYRYNFFDFLYRYGVAATLAAVLAAVIIVLVIILLHQRMRLAENKADQKAKNRFLSTMSHEIRTPLNGLLGLNQLMSQKLDDKNALGGYLEQSDATAKYLLSLVNDMLDMSSIQSDRLTLDLHPIDLQLVTDTVNSIAGNAIRQKGLEYNSDAEFLQRYIMGDDVRIQQIILSILDNARKFTPKGSVSLKILQEDDGRDITTIVEVADTGRGMSEKFQKRIFNAFEQELDTVSKGNQGVGLGLPISRSLARLMGGDITFESSRSSGSVFRFTFKAQPALPDEIEHENSEPKKLSRRVLVAEDNELNAEIIIQLLQENGYDADRAEDGEKALEAFRESPDGFYGVVLMDLLMPNMNGFEAAEAIRGLEREDAKSVRIIACTANDFDDERAKALESGMDDFVTKPVDIRALIRIIEEI